MSRLIYVLYDDVIKYFGLLWHDFIKIFSASNLFENGTFSV